MSAPPTPQPESLTWESLGIPSEPLTKLCSLVRMLNEREKLRALHIQLPGVLLIARAQLGWKVAHLLARESGHALLIANPSSTPLPVVGAAADQVCEGPDAQYVAAMYARARACAPSILYFGGIEQFGPKRGTPLATASRVQAVTQFLVEIENNRELNRDVFLFTATGDPELMDAALFCHITHHIEIPAAH